MRHRDFEVPAYSLFDFQGAVPHQTASGVRRFPAKPPTAALLHLKDRSGPSLPPVFLMLCAEPADTKIGLTRQADAYGLYVSRQL
jgi:hypothetical protein